MEIGVKDRDLKGNGVWFFMLIVCWQIFVFVEGTKGKKGRYTLLSEKILRYLRIYIVIRFYQGN